jgi:hypothetical protein
MIEKAINLITNHKKDYEELLEANTNKGAENHIKNILETYEFIIQVLEKQLPNEPLEDGSFGVNSEFEKPDCYMANDNPYPLCKGFVQTNKKIGLYVCDRCCLYENYAGDEPPME